MLKGDGSILIHSDGGSYKPLNWMSPPCSLAPVEPSDEQVEAGVTELWRVVHAKTADQLIVSIYGIVQDTSHDLGIDPASSRTASRRTCRSSWRRRSRYSEQATRSCAGST